METNLKTYIGYDNANNPAWFKKMCLNLHKINSYQWTRNCQLQGMFWKRKKYERIISKLTARNESILKEAFPKNQYDPEEYTFIFSMWKDRKNQSVPTLEIWTTENIPTLRKIKPDEVKSGKAIVLDGDSGPVTLTIDEVINPTAKHKAFSCDDGSRYGISHAYSIERNNDS